jgi:hypothetical protein
MGGLRGEGLHRTERHKTSALGRPVLLRLERHETAYETFAEAYRGSRAVGRSTETPRALIDSIIPINSMRWIAILTFLVVTSAANEQNNT